jgi:L-asparaginase / beta-aspartyl-peptidase
MGRIPPIAVLIAHGGAGGRSLAAERTGRRRGLIAAVERGAEILRGGGSAVDAVMATVVALEDDPLFNAGYGSVLNSEGKVEMDAGLMAALPAGTIHVSGTNRTRPGQAASRQFQEHRLLAGAVAAVSRVRNPIVLARMVMERTPHVLMVGAGAERLARRSGIRRCRAEDLISQRARERWKALVEAETSAPDAEADAHGTVGAVALDIHGELAAATSTGGITGKLPGRVGDSAIMGAGVFATARGAASATGSGEAIMKVSLCHEVVMSLDRLPPRLAAESAITGLAHATGGQAGVILVDRSGHVGYAHNTGMMGVAMFSPAEGVRHLAVGPIAGVHKR